MKKKKINIEDMPLNNIDLNLIKDFIDLYEDVKEKVDEYNTLCDEIRTNTVFKEELSKNPDEDLVKVFDRIRIQLINKISECKNEEELKTLNTQIKELHKQAKKLNQYDGILKIYNDEIYGRKFPSDYFGKVEKQNKYEYMKQQNSTITQVYKYTKYLYEICEKLYDYKPEKKSKNILTIIKTKIKKLKLKKKINKVQQDYIKDSEMNIARINDTLFIDIDSLEQNFEYYKIFEGPIFKFVMNQNEKITKARKEAEKEVENEIIISNVSETTIEPEIVELSREEQIENLKTAKEELTKLKYEEIPEEIIIPTKTA